MKLEDVQQAPITRALIAQQLATIKAANQSSSAAIYDATADALAALVTQSGDFEKKLGLAVAALKESERLIWGFPAMDAIVCIQKALAQIEEKK
jgi:hypothetical protein